MRASCLRRSLCAAALALAIAAPARAELRISDLVVFLNDHEVTVQVVLFAAVPDAFQEGIQSGIPAHVRFTVELWQYNRYWRDRLLTEKLVERALVYNVVTKEFRVASLKGEARPVHITREFVCHCEFGHSGKTQRFLHLRQERSRHAILSRHPTSTAAA